MKWSAWLVLAIFGVGLVGGTLRVVGDGKDGEVKPRPKVRVVTPALVVPGTPPAPGVAPAKTDPPAKAAPAIPALAPASPAPAPSDATHQVAKTIKVTGQSGASLQTLAATPEGQVVCLVAASRYAPVGASGATQSPQTEVCVFDRDGQEVRRWKVSFPGQSIAVGPQGDVYVAGNGRVARYSAAGTLDLEVEVPHLVELLKDNQALERQAREQIKASAQSYETQITNLKEQIEQIEKDGKAKGETLDVAKHPELRLLKSQLQAYQNALQSIQRQVEQQNIANTVRSLTSRLRIINGLAVTDKDVYLMCGETKGYGYALWRMDLKFAKSEKVLSRLSGCCGQMDVQARGDLIAIAENTRHRVARYEHDGTLADSFGARARESSGANFGGCCNPMNCRIMPNGELYTAESEGIIKKFDAKGQFVALVGAVRLTGGCKNVAVAASASGDRVYFCDQPGSQFVILEPKPAAAPAAAGGGS